MSKKQIDVSSPYIPYRLADKYSFGSETDYPYKKLIAYDYLDDILTAEYTINNYLNDYDENVEKLQFLKILSDTSLADPGYSTSITVQKFYYHDKNGEFTQKSVDEIINDSNLKELLKKYYIKTKNESNYSVFANIDQKYDFYEALNTVQKMGVYRDEIDAFKKHSENNNPSSQDKFYQIYNDYGCINNDDDTPTQEPFSTQIYRAKPILTDSSYNYICTKEKHLDDNTNVYVTTEVRPVFYYKLNEKDHDKSLSCHLECRNIKIPYKVVPIDDINYMCIMPEYLLKYVDSDIYRKLIFNKKGAIIDCNEYFNYDETKTITNANILENYIEYEPESDPKAEGLYELAELTYQKSKDMVFDPRKTYYLYNNENYDVFVINPKTTGLYEKNNNNEYVETNDEVALKTYYTIINDQYCEVSPNSLGLFIETYIKTKDTSVGSEKTYYKHLVYGRLADASDENIPDINTEYYNIQNA